MFKKVRELPYLDFNKDYIGIYFEKETCISIIISAESQLDASDEFHRYLEDIFIIYDSNCVRVRPFNKLDII